jgi:2-succinyl-5-enolpyruvyl-6-hydroxy-3-cyclohexene-1-carboxylate synthase
VYSSVKSVRYLSAVLKKYGVKYAVLSSGTCSIPVLRTLEVDDDFVCFSDIDERSAVFFAIGIAQASNSPVAVVCTSGTAACNYLPGVIEAKKLHVPLVIVTCDKIPYGMGNKILQKINQDQIFGDNVKISVCPPIIKKKEDEKDCEWTISKALYYMTLHTPGPVHINLYTDGEKKTFESKSLPVVLGPIAYYDHSRLKDECKELKSILKTKNRILITVGQMPNPLAQETVHSLEMFCKKFPAVIIAENISNFRSQQKVLSYRITEQVDLDLLKERLAPDLIISIGEYYAAYQIMPFLKQTSSQHEFWCVNHSGYPANVWNSLSKVFECSILDFFSMLSNDEADRDENEYYKKWDEIDKMVSIPDDIPFSSFMAVVSASSFFEKCHMIHAAILNSTRLVNMVSVPDHTTVYSNLGALGIDGCLSTFLGQASETHAGLDLCVIGDLSFLYDANALLDCTPASNMRIILLNNGGGSEFHFNTGINVIPEIDDYIAAGHTATFSHYAQECGFRYYSAKKEDELEKVLPEFFSDNGAAFLEVKTDIEEDAQVIKEVRARNTIRSIKKVNATNTHMLLRKIIGVRRAEKLVRIAKIILEKGE